jgi:hypothetical protein
MAQLRGTAHERPAEDPLLRRMLATHMHCGEAMELVAAKTSPVGLPDGKNEDCILTYRCACGFSFDQRQD